MVKKKPRKGRPPIVIDEAMLIQTEALASQGCSKTEIARVIGMGLSTLMEKQKAIPEFLEAIKRGQAKGVATICNSLFQTAKGGNVTAQIFFLKNRSAENWKDRVPEGTGVEDQQPVKYQIEMIDGRKKKKKSGTGK